MNDLENKKEYTSLVDDLNVDLGISNDKKINDNQTQYKNLGTSKKYAYITILKQWIVFEKTSYNKETKNRSTVVLVDKILPRGYKFWINGNNMYPNNFYQTDIISCSIDMNDENPMFVTQQLGEKEKNTITRDKFISYWKEFIEPKIEQYKLLGSAYFETPEVQELFSHQKSEISKLIGIESFMNLLDKEINRLNYKKDETISKPAEGL